MDDIFQSLKNFKFEKNNSDDHIDQKELYIMEALKRNSTTVKCPKCNVVGNEPNMYRWHFDNCETIFKDCQQCGNIIPRQGIKPFLYDKKKFCNQKCYMESKKGIPPIIMTNEIKNKLSIISLEQKKERSERIKKVKPWNTRWKKNMI